MLRSIDQSSIRKQRNQFKYPRNYKGSTPIPFQNQPLASVSGYQKYDENESTLKKPESPKTQHYRAQHSTPFNYGDVITKAFHTWSAHTVITSIKDANPNELMNH